MELMVVMMGLGVAILLITLGVYAVWNMLKWPYFKIRYGMTPKELILASRFKSRGKGFTGSYVELQGANFNLSAKYDPTGFGGYHGIHAYGEFFKDMPDSHKIWYAKRVLRLMAFKNFGSQFKIED